MAAEILTPRRLDAVAVDEVNYAHAGIIPKTQWTRQRQSISTARWNGRRISSQRTNKGKLAN